ncbi:Calcineurin-like phosphoesterase family protein [Leishmania donovani]|uniref:Calcineurin-like phosphoesterase family protein n=3 Tax=Leishmania donovani TaxID=5661 RepID=A0A504XAK1_LEIDO|nr:Calcineurin-like phosphoesterase family protein [Leishmania donovani]
MSSHPFDRSTRRTHSPSKIFPNTNSHAPRSPFSSPTLQRHDDPFKNSENILFSTFGAGSVSAATPATAAAASSSSLSPLFRASENGSSYCGNDSGDQHAGAVTPKTSPPAQPTLSSERSGARSALPDALERIARRLSTLITTSPAHEPTTAAAPEKSPASPVEWASAPATVEDATTSMGAGSRSTGGGGTTRSSTESRTTIPLPCVRLPPKISTAPSPPAPPALQPRRAHQIHEPFPDRRPAIPWKLRHPTSPPHSRPSVAMAERPSTLAISEAKTSNRLPDPLRSPTDRTREHLLSNRSFSSVLEAVAGGTSLSSTPDFQEEEGVQHKRTFDFFGATPHSGEFLPLIEWLLRRGERGDVGAPTASQKDGDEYTQASFFNEDYIMKLCAAATAVLVKEPTLLELEVVAHDTLVVVGDIHGQFQDLYTSVLCQQYDRRRCNPDGRDRRFLFMGDYVDRGPHSLEVVLLLLALKVEYPTLVYLTRGNHEEEKTSRVYGFLTEATSSLGAAAGTAVWSAVNKVFLDLPLAAIVQTLYMRFFVTHGGLSPVLQNVEDICALERHNYSCGNITAAEDDLIAGLLWSDPTNEVAMYEQNPRGCGFLFGPSASNRFCADNNFDFICRAHQVAMEGHMWTHNDRVLTIFSAPNYCGVNGNKGAVLLIKGCSRRPIVQQYDSAEKNETAPARKTDFAYAHMFT